MSEVNSNVAPLGDIGGRAILSPSAIANPGARHVLEDQIGEPDVDMRQQTKQYSIEEIREPELQNLFKLSQNVFYQGMDNSGGGAGASLDAMLNNQQ